MAILLGAFFFRCTTSPVRDQPPSIPLLRDRTAVSNEILVNYLDRTGSPSVQAAAVGPDGAIWAASRGVSSPASKQPVDSSTVYRLASVSKVFSALAVYQLAAQGKIALDSSITRIIPEFKTPCPEAQCAPITVRQLIVHASGLPRGEVFVWHPLTGAPLIEKLSHVMPAYPPGVRFSYSNIGYALLGEIVSRASGREFRKYVGDEILAPLGMHSTGFAPMDSALPMTNQAVAHPVPGMRPLIQFLTDAEGGMYSSLSDMSKFTSWLLQGGRLPQYGDTAAPLLDSLIKPFHPSMGLPESAYCGFGNLRINHGRPTPFKTGHMDGFSSGIFLDLERRIGVVALANRDLEMDKLGFELLGLFCGVRKDSIGFQDRSILGIFRAESLQDLRRFEGDYVLGIDYPVPLASLKRDARGLVSRFGNKTVYSHEMKDGWAWLRFTQAWDRQWLFFEKEYEIANPQLGFFSREGTNYVFLRGPTGIRIAAESPRSNPPLEAYWESRAGEWADSSGYVVRIYKENGRLFFHDGKIGKAWLLEPVSEGFAGAGGPCRSQGLTLEWGSDGTIDYRMGIHLRRKSLGRHEGLGK